MNAPQHTTLADPAPRFGAPVLLRHAALPGELTNRILVFGTLLGWCAILLVFRMHQAATFAFAFLEWNLFLAAIPAVAAWLFAKAAEGRAFAAIQGFWFAIWLAFLPNAPYVTTDLVHLGHSAVVPLWYDLVLLVSCACTGLLLGYTSLADVQAAIAQKFSTSLGWSVAITALLLSGFGIYLGRFMRLNSWDAISRPLVLVSDIARLLGNPGASSQVAGVTLIYGIGLLLGYVSLRMLCTSWAGKRI